MLGGDGALVANTQLSDVNIPLDYTIGLYITPGPTINSEWAAIVHFTATDTNCCDYGSRIPGIWFWPGTRKILVVDGHGANGNSHTGDWGCDDDLLTLAEGQQATLTMVMNSDRVNIYVNGDWACQAPRADRQVWENTKVYAADPWYAAADAAISGLYLLDHNSPEDPPAGLLANGEFSADIIPDAPGYVYMNPTGWEDSTGGIVVVRNGNGPWGGLDSGGGAHFISIQGSGATLRQTLTGLTVGTEYTVGFLVTHRPGYGNDETIHVKIDGTVIWETNHPEVRVHTLPCYIFHVIMKPSQSCNR